MTNQSPKSTGNLDRTSAIALAVALLAALTLYFVFYVPAIDKGVRSEVLPAKEILWLQIHIAVYGISYFLYIMGLLLAILCFLRKTTTRFPWIEVATLLASVLAVIGLITGIIFSQPAWNTWWVWDAKHTVVLLNTFLFIVISLFVVLTRLFAKVSDRNIYLIFLLFAEVSLCAASFLAGFMRNVHPQWFLNILF